jgi:hypothetical protein
MKTIFDIIFYIIPYSYILIVIAVLAIKIFNRKEKSIKKPFHRVLNWLPVATIPLFIGLIFEGDHLFKIIPIIIIILYEFLYQSKLLNKFEIIISMILYLLLNLFLYGFLYVYVHSTGV